jgi:hypothetical protein
MLRVEFEPETNGDITRKIHFLLVLSTSEVWDILFSLPLFPLYKPLLVRLGKKEVG